MVRRLAGWTAAIVAVMWVINDPVSAAHLVQGAGHLITHATTSLSTISRHVTGG